MQAVVMAWEEDRRSCKRLGSDSEVISLLGGEMDMNTEAQSPKQRPGDETLQDAMRCISPAPQLRNGHCDDDGARYFRQLLGQVAAEYERVRSCASRGAPKRAPMPPEHLRALLPGEILEPIENQRRESTHVTDVALQSEEAAKQGELTSPVEGTTSLATPLSKRSERNNGPEDLQLHAYWVVSMNSNIRVRSMGSRVNSISKESSFGDQTQMSISTEILTQKTYDGKLKQCISLPNAPQRVAWDIVGAVLILYDLVTIPMKFFDPPENTFTKFMDWFALIFWTVNMPASLFVAYLHDGKYEMHPKKILLNYLKFWFWIDIIVVLPDWCFTLANEVEGGGGNDAGSSVKLLRILRLVRCMRLLRLAKLKWLIAGLKDLINSESIDILFNIVKMIMCLVACNHFIACFWFACSQIEAERDWVTEHNLQHESWIYKYMTSFHWAITQFTPSSMSVQPQNIVERTYAITVVVFGLVGFSYLVGSITGSLTELRRMNEDGVKQFWNLRRYLKKNQVKMTLRIRIEKYLEHAWQRQKEAAVGSKSPLLTLLTEQLKNELNCAIFMPHLEVHPLFSFLSNTQPLAMQRIATTALTRKLLARDETYFQPGEIAQNLSFVIAGRLRYTKTVVGKGDHQEWVDKGEDWITEPVLWTPNWVTIGDLTSANVSELLEVSSSNFKDAISRTPQVYEQVCTYASKFLQWYQSMSREEQSDICQGENVGTQIQQMVESSGGPGRTNSWTVTATDEANAAKVAKVTFSKKRSTKTLMW